MAEQYKKVYHHTRYSNLEKIITNKGVLFRGSYYERFDNEDYGWTKRCVLPIIEKLCKGKSCICANESTFKPIIISFGQEDKSDYMWTQYADNYKGIQFVLNYDAIRSYADSNLDYFNKCVYLENNPSEIENYLATSIDELRIVSPQIRARNH